MKALNFAINYPLPQNHAELADSLAEKVRANASLSLLNVSDENLIQHRETVGRWLNVSPESITFGSGGHQILASIVSAFTKHGEAIACEEISYNGWLEICRSQGRRSIAIAMDELGMIPEALDAAASKEKIWGIFLMPSLHNPLSISMPLKRRESIRDICRKHDLWIIDDDAYRFLNPEKTEGFAHLYPEKTFWIHSFTKSLFPSLKTAVVSAPKSSLPALEGALRYRPSNLALPWIMDLMKSGRLDQVLTGKQEEARKRQTLAAEVLKGLSYDSFPTSFHLWMKVPAGWEPEGIQVMPGSKYTVDGRLIDRIRITLAGENEREKVKEGLENLARQLRQ